MQRVTETSVHITDRMSVPDAIALGVQRVNNAVDEFDPVAVFGMFSGGHDSCTATYIASQSRRFRGAAHLNTGIGVEETREYVRSLCAERGWALTEHKAMENTYADGRPNPQDYFAQVRAHGFPGPGAHWRMYVRLKERGIEKLVRQNKRKGSRQCVGLVTGARFQESDRRKVNVTKPVEKRGGQLWINPLWDFSKLDCSRIMEHAGIPRNPVVDLIHKSGECLCGAFAKPGELDELALWFPKSAAVIRALEAEVKERFPWGWGGRPPRKGCKVKGAGPLCSSCDVNYAEEQAMNLRPFADTNPGL
jgi:3'-phosphoadenosine 5'-phosphosulfate sulfotransferase (PAPS reductase)/FAD synthetase